ncbi:UDP-N-acetyl-D-mannosamine dehydrogenase [Glaesserella parasuis]|uniref:UDP-N-acetyl-D-mannosamine dehydrogenase n=1 Tax=Glaesserella parasuis TaxID=738 RepID=UPI0024371629|nr:UDP-N-acetyl-D-mannosamine dehydrogenase [Glaesserella parasuis]MDG6239931.1 UDP-N-acetyl-D-mannosamine dehydrogenase [Glaesserella parasuis]
MAVFEQIVVVGLGYIGLPTAAAFALAGLQVIGIDCNPRVIEQINQGRSHLHEPELAQAVLQAVSSGHFYASTEPTFADAFIIAVPTPLQANHQPDLTAIQSAVKSIAPYLRQGNLVVLESTSPVGTTEQLAQWIEKERPDLSIPTDVAVAYCPERVLPSNIWHELYHNDRVIGGLTPNCTQQAVALYQLFAKGECITTDSRLAEMCKLTENSFRDVNIAFANELSMICDQLNVNVWELIRIANRHPRVSILQPGAGVGGHCIAIDPWFIVAQSEHARLIRTAREVNDSKAFWVIDKIKSCLAECAVATNRKISDLTLACLGITFKANVSDLRESPALAITEYFADWHQGKLWVVEPHIAQLPASLAEKVEWVDFAQGITADVVVFLVDHLAFQQHAKRHLSPTWLVDTRGAWTN